VRGCELGHMTATRNGTTKRLVTAIVCGCATLVLTSCGSSSDKASTTSTASTASTGSTASTANTASEASSQVCSARDDIESQAQTLSSLSSGTATKANVTSTLNAVKSDLQKMKDAQPGLAPDRKQEVQAAVTAFGTQLSDIVRQTVAGLSKSDAQSQAKNAGASLTSAVKESLQPISC
jgi:hypothetical protein